MAACAASVTLRHMWPAVLGAATAAFTAVAVGIVPIADAAWDSAEYDACTTRTDLAWLAGDITTEEHIYFYELCCARTGGHWTPHGNQGLGVCGAAPALGPGAPSSAPSEVANSDVPAGSPAQPPKGGPQPTVPRTPLTLTPVAPVG